MAAAEQKVRIPLTGPHAENVWVRLMQRLKTMPDVSVQYGAGGATWCIPDPVFGEVFVNLVDDEPDPALYIEVVRATLI